MHSSSTDVAPIYYEAIYPTPAGFFNFCLAQTKDEEVLSVWYILHPKMEDNASFYLVTRSGSQHQTKEKGGSSLATFFTK